MVKNNIQAVIFDCDGTLVDSEVPGIQAGLAAGMQVHALRPDLLQQVRLIKDLTGLNFQETGQ